MSATHGYGILRIIFSDDEYERSSEEEKLAALIKFADLGLTKKFFEVIGDKLYRIEHEDGRTEIDTVEGKEWRAKIAAWGNGYTGSISFDDWVNLQLDFSVPNYAGPEPAGLRRIDTPMLLDNRSSMIYTNSMAYSSARSLPDNDELLTVISVAQKNEFIWSII